MSINVKNRCEGGEAGIEQLLGRSGPALDALWKTRWVGDGIGPGLKQLVKKIEMEAGAFHFKCDRIAVVAEGPAADMLRCAAALADTGRREVIVTGGTLSARTFGRLIGSLQEGSCGLVGVALDPESPSFCAAFATIRKLINDKYGAEERKKRIKAVVTERSQYLREEAKAGDIELLEMDGEYAADLAGDSLGMLFPMMAMGVSGSGYVEGFREMLSSTWWDLDGDRYALYLAQHMLDREKDARTEDVLVWQEELMPAGQWLAAMHRSMGIQARVLQMPAERDLLRKDAYKTTLRCRKEETDVMLPLFPGVSPEGSLNEMLKENAEAVFGETGGTMIVLEEMTPSEIGKFAAYIQLSAGITEFIVQEV